jgi:ATP-dependent Clp protease ATP-binding subunit ClpB
MEEITEIVKLLLKQLEERLKERNITLEVTPEALNVAAKNGYDPVYGARPLKRYLQKRLETRIARLIISGEAAEGSVIRVEKQGNDLVIHVE